jgi:hypothetical protein
MLPRTPGTDTIFCRKNGEVSAAPDTKMSLDNGASVLEAHFKPHKLFS